MTKKFLKEQKGKLEEEERKLEEELKHFAKKDADIKGNWKTKFPYFGPKTADTSEEIDQREEYEASLSIEHVLEIKLQKIKNTLERIKKGTYGICQTCGKKIEVKRLKVCPEANTCIKCSK